MRSWISWRETVPCPPGSRTECRAFQRLFIAPQIAAVGRARRCRRANPASALDDRGSSRADQGGPFRRRFGFGVTLLFGCSLAVLVGDRDIRAATTGPLRRFSVERVERGEAGALRSQQRLEALVHKVRMGAPERESCRDRQDTVGFGRETLHVPHIALTSAPRNDRSPVSDRRPGTVRRVDLKSRPAASNRLRAFAQRRQKSRL